jgi:hypothetical protein
MPVDPGGNAKDRAKAFAAIAFFVIAFIIIYIVSQMTATPPPGPK